MKPNLFDMQDLIKQYPATALQTLREMKALQVVNGKVYLK